MSPQQPPTLDDLLPLLNTATDNKSLRWTTTADGDTFRAEFGSNLIRIAKESFPTRYVLTIVDQDGTVLEEYEPSGEGTLLALDRLHKKVRRQALDLDKKLKTVFDQLKRLADNS